MTKNKEIKLVGVALYLILGLPLLTLLAWSKSAALLTEPSDVSVFLGILLIGVLLLHVYIVLRLSIPFLIKLGTEKKDTNNQPQ